MRAETSLDGKINMALGTTICMMPKWNCLHANRSRESKKTTRKEDNMLLMQENRRLLK